MTIAGWILFFLGAASLVQAWRADSTSSFDDGTFMNELLLIIVGLVLAAGGGVLLLAGMLLK